MIKANINKEYPSHLEACKTVETDDSLFVADYTNKTRLLPPHEQMAVIFFEINAPVDIDCFSIQNNIRLEIVGVKFDNTSFTYPNGCARSQCECVVFPKNSTHESWILFAELKYASNNANNHWDLTKALKQLYKTRTYYFQKGVFTKTNTCYLIASLPSQPEPFINWTYPPDKVLDLKDKHNVVLRFINNVEIKDDKQLIA